MKNSSINYDLKWSITCKAHPYTGGTKKFDLYLTEKLAMMKAGIDSLLNTRDEFFFPKGSFFLRELLNIVYITAVVYNLGALTNFVPWGIFGLGDISTY